MESDQNANLMPLEFEGHSLSVQFDQEGAPWWIAQEIIAALGLKGDAGQHVRRLDDDEKTLISIQGGSKLWIINEPGLYNLLLGARTRGKLRLPGLKAEDSCSYAAPSGDGMYQVWGTLMDPIQSNGMAHDGPHGLKLLWISARLWRSTFYVQDFLVQRPMLSIKEQYG